MIHKDTATTAREECDTRALQWFTHWVERAEAWMVEAARADKFCQDYQRIGAPLCAALCARDAVTATREYQRCLVNAESWL